MRRVRYSVASSLDGYIAGPQGEDDWIVVDPSIDFGALFGQFDTALMGRRTFARMKERGASLPGMETYVFSGTLRKADHPEVTIVAEGAAHTVASLRTATGKDIWLFGGGSLCSSLLTHGLVDTVEVALIPVLLGRGVPLLPHSLEPVKLRLSAHSVLEKTGTLLLEYAVV